MLTINRTLTENEAACIKERWCNAMAGAEVIIWAGLPKEGPVELRSADGDGGVIVSPDFAADLLAPREADQC